MTCNTLKHLWGWEERMKSDAFSLILPAFFSCFRGLLTPLTLLLVLCKVTAVTVVGLISAVIGAVVV